MGKEKATDDFVNDKPVYWDEVREQFYWIKWEETGNSDIPYRHYISVEDHSHGPIGGRVLR